MYSEAMRLLDMLEQISIVIVTVSNPKKGMTTGKCVRQGVVGSKLGLLRLPASAQGRAGEIHFAQGLDSSSMVHL